MMIVCLVAAGDSITFGGVSYFYQYLGIPSTSVFALTANYTTAPELASSTYYATIGGKSVIARNMAVPGTRLNTNGFPDVVPLASTPGYIDSWIPAAADKNSSGSVRKYIFLNAIGTNDSVKGGLATPALYAAAVAASCVARKTAGYDLVGMTTIFPRDEASAAMIESDRAAYNALLRTPGWAASVGVDFIIDLPGGTIMDDKATCSNATYYNADKIHPLQAGHALAVPNVVSVLTPIIAAL